MKKCRLLCVADASVLIDFLSVGLETLLLSKLFKCTTTDLVFQEIADPGQQRRLLSLGLEVKELSGDKVAQIASLQGNNRGLSVEDFSAYILAETNDATLLTGDKLLRALARNNSIEVHGTIWIMGELIDGGVITTGQAKDCLRRMIEKGSRIPVRVCERHFGHFY
jgi:predicted nucleic acid-binding protein